MLGRFLGVLSGLTLILIVLHWRGLPVLILLKAIPLFPSRGCRDPTHHSGFVQGLTLYPPLLT